MKAPAIPPVALAVERTTDELTTDEARGSADATPIHPVETPAHERHDDARTVAADAVAVLVQSSGYFVGYVDYEKKHKVAKCRWCGGSFVRYFHHWVCEHAACQDRCAAHAVLKPIITEGESPFLYLPLPLQVEIEESPVRRLLIEGPQGWGKSYAARWILYKRCQKYRGYRALLLRCTYDQLDKNHLQYIPDELAQIGNAIFKRGTQESKHVEFTDNQARIYVGYCEHAIHIAQHKGPEWDDVDLEEASEFLPLAIQLITARDRGSATAREAMYQLGVMHGRSRLYTNPGGRAALHLKEFYIDKNPDPKKFPEYDPSDYGCITGKIEDNPYLAENHRSSTLGGLDAEHLAMYADGRWDVFPGQFFRRWQHAKHVADLDEHAEDLPVIGAIRWSHNGTGCFLWANVLPNNRVYVKAQWRFSNLSVQQAAEEIKTRTGYLGVTKCQAIYAMPDMGGKESSEKNPKPKTESHVDTFRRHGVSMRMTDENLYHGWQRVQDYLDIAPDGLPWLVVSPSCDSLVRTLPSLMQDDNHPDELDNGQDDSDAHALRCLLVSRPAPQPPKVSQVPPKPFTLGWFKALDAQEAGR